MPRWLDKQGCPPFNAAPFPTAGSKIPLSNSGARHDGGDTASLAGGARPDALTVQGCGGPKSDVDGGSSDGSAAVECDRDQDCPKANLYLCINFECVPSCRTKEDCSDAVRGDEHKLPVSGSLGCQCEDFKCAGALCSEDSKCNPSTVCRSGACVAPPAAAAVSNCQVTPDLVIGREGTTAKFWVSAWNASNEPVVLKSGISWAPVGAVTTGSAMGSSATFTLGAATAGTAGVDAVEATVGTVKCRGKARILPALTGGNWRALVTDELTGRAITGATLVVSNPTTGAAVSTVAVVDGVASFASAVTPITATVFHADYGYLTIANYTPSGGADARDL